MQKVFKRLMFLFLLCFLISGCAEEKKAAEREYSEITILASKENSVDVLGLKDGKIYKIDAMTNVSDMVYNYENHLYIYQVKVTSGQNLDQNKIKIELKDKERIVNNFFYSMDIKISPKGGKIAYRSFMKDSYESAEGLTIYDINLKKNLKLKTSILVSGNLYNWLNEDEIVYYGISPENKEYNKLYKYNFKEASEKIYTDNIKDFCTFFTLVKDKGALCLEETGNETRLIFNELENKKRNLISNSISNIYYAAYFEKSDSLFFIGLDKNEEECALFKISMKDLSLTRITYDFPKEVDRFGGLALDSLGNVYFCGINNNNNNQVYMLKSIDQSINLITSQKGRYYLGGNNK